MTMVRAVCPGRGDGNGGSAKRAALGVSVIRRTVVPHTIVEDQLMAQAIPPHGTEHTRERVPRTADGIAAALAPARRMDFYRELGTSPVESVEAVLRRWWCEAMPDTDPQGERIAAAATEGTLALSTMDDIVVRRRERG
jgi:hypothetical protein